MNDPFLSVFQSATNPHPVCKKPLSAIAERIRSPELSGITAKIAKTFADAGGGKEGKKAIEGMKKSLPAVTLAGTFTRRAIAGWAVSSDLVQIDLDNMTPERLNETRASLSACPWSAILWTSPSGAGFKGGICVPPMDNRDETYKKAWHSVTRWLASLGLENDPAAKDCSRLAFLAHDPLAFYNPDATPFDVEKWAPIQPAIVQAEPQEPRQNTVETHTQRTGNVLDRARRYLNTLPPSISGESGHGALLRAAVVVAWGFDLPDAEALQLLREYNGRAMPPWDDRDIVRKLSEAHKLQHREPRGHLRDSVMPRHETPAANGPDFASERLLAERLSRSDLPRSLRFVLGGPSAGWRRWSGICWDVEPSPVPLCLQGAVHQECGRLITEGKLDPKTARLLESSASMAAILRLLQAFPSMQIDHTQTDPVGLLCCPNGILDLKTKTLTPADPNGPCFLRSTAVDYDPGARDELWDEVSNHVAKQTGGQTVQNFLGGALYGLPADRKTLWNVGEGQDGKSTLGRASVAALGGFADILGGDSLAGNGRGSAHAHELLAGLGQSRLVFASEIPRGIDWDLLKTLAGGDSFKTKRLNARAQTLTIRAWLCLASNDEPRPPDAASADRTIIARWTKPDEANPEIMAILGTPGPARDSFLRACLRWLVDGFQAFHRDGLLIPDCARAKEEPEGLCAWWERSLEDGSILPGFTWTIVGDFAKHAAAWFQTRGEAAPNMKALGSILRSRLPPKRQTIDGKKSVFYRAKVRL